MNSYQKKHNTTNKLEEQLWQYIYIDILTRSGAEKLKPSSSKKKNRVVK